MEIEKVKVDKFQAIFVIVGILFMLISGIVILLKTSSDDRMQIIAWIFLGVCGWFLYSKTKNIYKKKKKIKKKSKLDKKKLDNLGRNFALLFILKIIINIGTAFYLAGTSLSNLGILFLYFPIAVGSTTLIFLYGVFILLWKNDFEIKKILKKLKKDKKK